MTLNVSSDYENFYQASLRFLWRSFLVVGAAFDLYKSGWLPAGIEARIFHTAEDNPKSLHLLQEFGALMIFTGILSFWFIKDYEQSAKFHFAMVVFWALMAIIHWTDALASGAHFIYPVINTIPLLLFGVTGVMRKRK